LRQSPRGAPILFGGCLTRERADVAAVGLTGGIGAGKSTALRFFAQAGASTVSADEVVHNLYLRADVRRAVAGHFGVEMLAEGREIDRTRLAAAVRGRREELAWLESLTHPLVAQQIRSAIGRAKAGSVVVCEVPLLFEAGMQELFDLIVTVEAAPEARRERSIHSFDLDQFGELEALQASSDRRVAGSDLAFFNDGHIDHLRSFVLEAYACARALAARGASGGARAPQPAGGEPPAATGGEDLP
jgi:dephospho-CoA kinase